MAKGIAMLQQRVWRYVVEPRGFRCQKAKHGKSPIIDLLVRTVGKKRDINRCIGCIYRQSLRCCHCRPMMSNEVEKEGKVLFEEEALTAMCMALFFLRKRFSSLDFGLWLGPPIFRTHCTSDSFGSLTSYVYIHARSSFSVPAIFKLPFPRLRPAGRPCRLETSPPFLNHQ